jgi:hypothetical protein
MANNSKVKGTADVVFLMDVTDSMDYCIDAVKKNIRIFVQELQKAGIDWRARIIGFRNHEFNPDNWLDADGSLFTSDLNELRRQLDGKKPSGGDPDSLEESVLDALHYVSQMGVSATKLDPGKWRPTGRTAKCVMLFTDAPCQDLVSYVPGNLELDDVGNALASSRIRLSIIAPDFDCYHELAEYGAIYVPCGKSEDFPKMHLSKDDLTPQEQADHKMTFEDIIRDFAKTVTATATEEAF